MHKMCKSKEIYTLKTLLDSEATATLINSKYVKHLKRHKRAPISCTTKKELLQPAARLRSSF